MPTFFALLVLFFGFISSTYGLDARSTGLPTTTLAYPYPSRASARPTTPGAVIRTFYWFQTEKLSPGAPTPTLRGRILSTDQFSFTKYRVTCEAKDVSLGCTYTDFTVTASGTSQLYYETVSPMRSVGCEVSNTTMAVCSSRAHGEDVTKAVTKTWKGADFPGYYPVIVTAEPTLEGRYEYDEYIYETHQPTVTAGGSVRRPGWILLSTLVGYVAFSSQLVVYSSLWFFSFRILFSCFQLFCVALLYLHQECYTGITEGIWVYVHATMARTDFGFDGDSGGFEY